MLRQNRYSENTPNMQQSKTLILSTNVNQKLLETEFSIAICQMAIENTVSSNPRSSIVINVKSVFDCRLSGVKIKMQYL